MEVVTNRLSDADAVLWTLDRDPNLRSPITAVVIFDQEVAFGEVLDRIRTLCRQHLHFRSVVVPARLPFQQPRWREEAFFDAADHLHHVRVALPGGIRAVLDLAQGMALQAFDPVRPPWEAHLVDGMEGGRAALILRVHHAVIDGVGGLQVAASMMDKDRAGTPLVPTEAPGPVVGPDGGCSARSAVGAVLSASRWLATSAWHSSTHPLQTTVRWRATTADTVRLVAPSPRPLSPVWRDRGLARHFETVDMPNDALGVGSGSGVTLNDVFLAGLLRGLSLYHHRHGSRVAHLRVVMPISTRRPSDPMESNRFVPARLVLPADLPDAGSYLRQVPPLLDKWKHTEALGVSDLLTSVIGRLPDPLTVAVLAGMLTGVDLVATNIPGPPVDVYFAGARVEEFYAFAPTSGAALNAALVTVADRTTIGLTTDSAAVTDPEVLVDCVTRGLAEVARTAAAGGGG